MRMSYLARRVGIFLEFLNIVEIKQAEIHINERIDCFRYELIFILYVNKDICKILLIHVYL